MTDVEDVAQPSKDGLEKEFRKFLDLGGLGARPKNDKRKAESLGMSFSLSKDQDIKRSYQCLARNRFILLITMQRFLIQCEV
jgi:hypothetical protein